MKIDLGVKTYLYPQPVMIIGTYDENMVPNAMNAAWGGICGYDEIMVDLGSHKTTDNIALNKAFTIGIADEKHTVACDYVGIVSANDEPEKLKIAGFTTEKSKFVNAPVINELPITIECELKEIIGSKYIGKIKNVVADESIIGEDGKPDLCKFSPITFDPVHLNYVALGKETGKAFECGKDLGKIK